MRDSFAKSMGEVRATNESNGPLTGLRLGRYRLGGRLGAGGTASVYLAVSDGPHNFGRVVALKVIHEHLLGEKAFVDMFLDEANLAVRLNHPNVVHVYDLLQEEGRLVLTMEYLAGQPLSRLVARVRQREERLPYAVVAWIAARALEGLHHAHQLLDERGQSAQVVHRDVSPQNIFITYSGHAKIIDFGIARAAGRLQQTELGQVKGKFAYMAPEQALSQQYDHRADIFSLGVTLYEAAVGARLFPELDRVEALHKIVMGEIPDPGTRVSGFPEELRRIILRAIEGDPERRFQSAKEMQEALDAFVEATEQAPVAERLAALMSEQFGAEREQQLIAIQALKAGEPGTFRVETDAHFGLASNTAIAPRKSPNYLAFGLGAALLLLGGFIALQRVLAEPGAAPSGNTPRAAAPGFSGASASVEPIPSASMRPTGPPGEPRNQAEFAGASGREEKTPLPKRSPLIKSYPF